MTTYEDLLNEAYKEGITVKEKPLKYSDGRIKGNKIAIRKSIETDKEKACILAEELGHYYTTVGNILDQNDSNNRRQELIARKWAYEKILPIENILFAVQDGPNHVSVNPTDISKMQDWMESRKNAETSPHPYTVILKK